MDKTWHKLELCAKNALLHHSSIFHRKIISMKRVSNEFQSMKIFLEVFFPRKCSIFSIFLNNNNNKTKVAGISFQLVSYNFFPRSFRSIKTRIAYRFFIVMNIMLYETMELESEILLLVFPPILLIKYVKLLRFLPNKK